MVVPFSVWSVGWFTDLLFSLFVMISVEARADEVVRSFESLYAF